MSVPHGKGVPAAVGPTDEHEFDEAMKRDLLLRARPLSGISEAYADCITGLDHTLFVKVVRLLSNQG